MRTVERLRSDTMKCPNCQAWDPTPPLSDNGTTTCPRCGHRFPIDETGDLSGHVPASLTG
jgi:uncharacterized paraquat-inducible protein A